MIKATRDSVCMGDDCTAPNTGYLDYQQNQYLSDWLLTAVTGYVPSMKNAKWIVFDKCKNHCIGCLYCDAEGRYQVELEQDDLPMRTLYLKEIFCRYVI